jgi:hypothetical protein
VAAGSAPQTAWCGYDFAGQGMTNVLSGSVANGGLFWSTVPTWLNSTPSLPYTNAVTFALPACDHVVTGRLVMTVWGGTADYVCQMTVNVNGSNLPSADPFVFGTTADANAVFSADAPCAYGSGYGVWLVALPVPGEWLFTNGAVNSVTLVERTPGGFDGRIQHVTLVAVYQAAALANSFDYALAEGSGDIRSSPSPPQVDRRTAVFGAVNPTSATAATLTALYTYGDTGQNDRLFFNGTQLGGDDVSQWDTAAANYGPSVVSFDMLGNVLTTNEVTFSVASSDGVPDPRDSNLRPQLAVLTVTRPPDIVPPTLSISVPSNRVELTITGEPNRTYTVLSSTNLSDWNETDSFVSTNVTSHWSVPVTNDCRFFRVLAQ